VEVGVAVGLGVGVVVELGVEVGVVEVAPEIIVSKLKPVMEGVLTATASDNVTTSTDEGTRIWPL
jgi:hypothetical protein